MKLFRIFVKSGKTSIKFISYMSCKIPGNFLGTVRTIPGFFKGLVQVKGPVASDSLVSLQIRPWFCKTSVRFSAELLSECFSTAFFSVWLIITDLSSTGSNSCRCVNLSAWFMTCKIKQHSLTDICLHQFERVALFKVKIIGYWNCSPFRFSVHKSSAYSGSLPSAVLSNSTVNTMKCRSIFQGRDNNLEFIKSLCTYHCFLADSFLFTRYSVEFIECNYSQTYCNVKNNIDEETFHSFFWDVSRFQSLVGPKQNMILGSLLLPFYLF